MDQMTKEQREAFIARRVKAILESHTELAKTMDVMEPLERDAYVHKRVELDLLVSENIQSELDRLMENHQSAYLHITILDAVTLAVIIALAIEVRNDLAMYMFALPTLLMVILTFAISRFLNYRMNHKLYTIDELMRKNVGREQQTAALDYLVDLVEHDLAVNGK